MFWRHLVVEWILRWPPHAAWKLATTSSAYIWPFHATAPNHAQVHAAVARLKTPLMRAEPQMYWVSPSMCGTCRKNLRRW